MDGQIGGVKAPVQLIRIKKAKDQPVTVAAQGVDGVGAGQLHHIPQQGEAVRPLLQQIPHQHQDVRRGQTHLVHQPPEKIQISVYVADGDDTAAPFKPGTDDDGLIHGTASSFGDRCAGSGQIRRLSIPPS